MYAETVLQIGASVTAITAAYIAMKTVELPRIPHDGPSISDVPELYTMTNRVAIDRLAEPNRKAGWFAIISAILSGAMPLWLFGKWFFYAVS
jgi:hypothetical protein